MTAYYSTLCGRFRRKGDKGYICTRLCGHGQRHRYSFLVMWMVAK